MNVEVISTPTYVSIWTIQKDGRQTPVSLNGLRGIVTEANECFGGPEFCKVVFPEPLGYIPTCPEKCHAWLPRDSLKVI